MKRRRNIHPGTSGDIARTRARLTVASDRLACSQEELQQMQKEIIDILSKYFELDENILKIRMQIAYRTNRGEQDVKTIQIK